MWCIQFPLNYLWLALLSCVPVKFVSCGIELLCRSLSTIEAKLDYPIKLIMLGLAFYMFVDQVFDGLQSNTYKIFSKSWNQEWLDDNLTACHEAELKECWNKIHNTKAEHEDRDVIKTACGDWDKTTQTITLNCKLLLHPAYFACSLACWLLPPVVFGSFLTYMKYQRVVLVSCYGFLVFFQFFWFNRIWFSREMCT